MGRSFCLFYSFFFLPIVSHLRMYDLEALGLLDAAITDSG